MNRQKKRKLMAMERHGYKIVERELRKEESYESWGRVAPYLRADKVKGNARYRSCSKALFLDWRNSMAHLFDTKKMKEAKMPWFYKKLLRKARKISKKLAAENYEEVKCVDFGEVVKRLKNVE